MTPSALAALFHSQNATHFLARSALAIALPPLSQPVPTGVDQHAMSDTGARQPTAQRHHTQPASHPSDVDHHQREPVKSVNPRHGTRRSTPKSATGSGVELGLSSNVAATRVPPVDATPSDAKLRREPSQSSPRIHPRGLTIGRPRQDSRADINEPAQQAEHGRQHPRPPESAARIKKPSRELAKAVAHRHSGCAICWDELLPGEEVALQPCGHRYCRECLETYIASRLREGKLPGLCPQGVAEKVDLPSLVSREVANWLDLTTEQLRVWDELSLATCKVQIDCRKCDRSTYMKMTQFRTMSILVCTHLDCSHRWCKTCHKTVPLGGPEHDCQDVAELRMIMQQMGWKPCPTCKTITEKLNGCNHVACPVPGCNTHWCYACGEVIAVDPKTLNQRREAVAGHFATSCNLFEMPSLREIMEQGVVGFQHFANLGLRVARRAFR